jgi:hypothetical protein
MLEAPTISIVPSTITESKSWFDYFFYVFIVILLIGIIIVIILATNTNIFKPFVYNLLPLATGEQNLIIKTEGISNAIKFKKPARFLQQDVAKKSINIYQIKIYDINDDEVFTQNNLNITTDSIEISFSRPINVKKIEIFPCNKDTVKACVNCSLDKCGIETKIDLKKIDYESPIYSKYNSCVVKECNDECIKCLNDLIGLEIILSGLDSNNQKSDLLKYVISTGDFVHELLV